MRVSRSIVLVPVVAFALGACTRVVYLPTPTQTPAPEPEPVVTQPEPEYREPLEVTVGRPVRDRFVVHTNRPAYVAIFEVIPEQGVVIVRPSSARDRYVVTGLTAVRTWWTPTVSRTAGAEPTRYVYALASDEPLRLAEAHFRQGAVRSAIGSRAYYAANPYETMRALARRFVVTGIEEEGWAEDAFVVQPQPVAATPSRVARVYCPDGTRFEVPVDMADRVRCPRATTVARREPPGKANGHDRRDDGTIAPDSVLGPDNRRVRTRPPVPGRGPIDRVREPVVAGNGGRGPVEKGGVPVAAGSNGDNGNHGNGNNGNHGNGNNGNHGNGNNGNHGTANNGNGRASDRADSVSRGQGRGVTGQPAADTASARPARGNGGRRVSEAWGNGAARRTAPPTSTQPAQPATATASDPAQVVRVRPAMDSLRAAPPRVEESRAGAEPSQPEPARADEAKAESKGEAKSESKGEAKPDSKPDSARAEEPKPEKPKAEPSKPEEAASAKPEPNGDAKARADSVAARLKKATRGRVNR